MTGRSKGCEFCYTQSIKMNLNFMLSYSYVTTESVRLKCRELLRKSNWRRSTSGVALSAFQGTQLGAVKKQQMNKMCFSVEEFTFYKRTHNYRSATANVAFSSSRMMLFVISRLEWVSAIREVKFFVKSPQNIFSCLFWSRQPVEKILSLV